MKPLYQLIGIIIIMVAIFFIGRLTVPTEPTDYLEQFNKAVHERDSLRTLHKLTQDSLHQNILQFNKEVLKGDSLEVALKEALEKKKNDYESINYTDMSADESYNRAKSRLDARIGN